MLFGLMVADYTAGAGPEHPVMTGKVARDTANNGAPSDNPLAEAGGELWESVVTPTANTIGTKIGLIGCS